MSFLRNSSGHPVKEVMRSTPNLETLHGVLLVRKYEDFPPLEFRSNSTWRMDLKRRSSRTSLELQNKFSSWVIKICN